MRLAARTFTTALTAGLLTVGGIVGGAHPALAMTANQRNLHQSSPSDVRHLASATASAAVAKGWKVPRLAVMPLGDSITEGAGSSAGSGYRPELWNRLTTHADSLDFVGSERKGKMPDPDHEGHWGWKIHGLSANVDRWLPAANPNVVLLQIGTNDMHDNYQVDTAPRRLGGLVDKIASLAPGMTVLVSSLITSADSATQKRIEKFNAVIPQLVAERQGQGLHVGYVDMSAVTTRDLADDIHPNDNGYLKMADAFYNGLGRAAADGWIRQQVDIKPAPSRKAPPGDYRVDVNGDGRADYLVVQDNGAVDAWINNGGNGHGEWTAFGTFATGVGEPGDKVRFADINGDGKADYLVVQDNGAVKAWINNGGTNHGGWTAFGTFASGVDEPGRVRFADINGDGKADYLVVQDYGVVKAWINNGGTNHGGWTAFGTFASGVGEPDDRVRFADINGDGKADYLVVQDNGAVDAWINDGGSNHGGWTEFGTFASGVGEPGDKVRFADINGDGRADYLVIQANGAVDAWINNGGTDHGGWGDSDAFATSVGEPGRKVRI
ncbi:FG-GAP-like repeat-containing protein [Streptomyces sp. NPDC051162]|uniref:FG-GAP-like repeat-containing protein n=1 Tax=Streptomyces sp. NPDC051162 TaxID=3154747 RepID=UPI00343F4D34